MSSWLSRLAARPTRIAPDSERVRRSATCGDPDQLQDACRGTGAQVGTEPALLPAPEVVGEADGGDREQARLRHGDDPADERQSQPAMVLALQAEGEQDVAELATTVEEAAEVAQVARCSSSTSVSAPVFLLDASPVIMISQPKPAARGKTAALGLLRQPSLARERLRRRIARPVGSAAGRPLLRFKAAALLVRECGDGEIGVAGEQRPEIAPEIGVAEQQVALARGALTERQRLAFAASRAEARARRPPRPPRRSRRASRRRRPPPWRRGTAGAARRPSSRSAPARRARGDQDRQVVSHLVQAAARSPAGSGRRCR